MCVDLVSVGLGEGAGRRERATGEELIKSHLTPCAIRYHKDGGGFFGGKWRAGNKCNLCNWDTPCVPVKLPGKRWDGSFRLTR